MSNNNVIKNNDGGGVLSSKRYKAWHRHKKLKVALTSALAVTTIGGAAAISIITTKPKSKPVLQFEPHTIDENLKVNDPNGTMKVTVAETDTESFATPEVHFLKDGINVDQYFEWKDNWSTNNLEGTRTIELKDATDQYWQNLDLNSSLNFQIEVNVERRSKTVDFQINSQNSISALSVVRTNLQVGVPNSEEIIHANTKGFDPEQLEIDTGETGLDYEYIHNSQWRIYASNPANISAGNKTIYLKAPQVEPEPFIVHVDSAQKIITTITSNNLQKNVTDTNATIALESENGANIDYIFCEDITENIEDNEKLQLTYDKDTQVLTAISVDSNNVATGEHKIKISSLLSPKWDDVIINLNVFSETQKAISAVVINDNLQKNVTTSTAQIKVNKFNIDALDSIEFVNLPDGLSDDGWINDGDSSIGTLQWNGIEPGEYTCEVKGIYSSDAAQDEVTANVDIFVRDEKNIAAYIDTNNMVYNNADSTAVVQIQLINSSNPSIDLDDVDYDLSDSGFECKNIQIIDNKKQFTFTPGTASIGSHQIKFFLKSDSNTTIPVNLIVSKPEEKMVHMSLDNNLLSLDTPAVPITATLTVDGFSPQELPTDISGFNFSDDILPEFNISWDNQWINNRIAKIEFTLKDDAKPGTYELAIGIDNVQSDPQEIEIVASYTLELPQTTDFFTFGTTYEPNDTITGYADAFVNSWVSDQTLNVYLAERHVTGVNTLSFQNKVVSSAQFAFSPSNTKYTNINTFYKRLGKLNFRAAKWNWDVITDQTIYGAIGLNTPIISTGICSFGGKVLFSDGETSPAADFSNVSSIDWNDVNFAPDAIPDALFEGDPAPMYVSTMSFTFSGINFESLRSLDLEYANFAGSFATSSTKMNNHEVYTALYTFYDTNLSKLEKLYLSGTRFAAPGMGKYFMNTASNTFLNSNLSNVKYLNLSQAYFADENMISPISPCNVLTADSTFMGANFNSVTEFSTSGTYFSFVNMVDVTKTTNTYVASCYNTFDHSSWDSLKTLNLTNTAFVPSTGSSQYVECQPAIGLFASSSMPSIEKVYITDLSIYRQTWETPQDGYDTGNGIDTTIFQRITSAQQDIYIYGTQENTYFEEVPYDDATTKDLFDSYWFGAQKQYIHYIRVGTGLTNRK